VTWRGSSFQTRAAATSKARSTVLRKFALRDCMQIAETRSASTEFHWLADSEKVETKLYEFVRGMSDDKNSTAAVTFRVIDDPCKKGRAHRVQQSGELALTADRQ